MTRQELKDLLLSKNEVSEILQENEASSPSANVKRYVINYRVVTGPNSINYKNTAYYVENEGLQNELAYWENSEPFPTTTPVVTFKSKVETFIQTKIADNTIKGAVITDINEINRSAFVKAVRSSDNATINALIADANNDNVLELIITT